MRAEVLRWCRREQLFAPGDRVLCAVSGGADSTGMLWCLHSLQAELGITLSAAHFHHGLRGTEADRDEAFVRALCAELNIPLAVGRADVAAYAAESGLSIETAAREKRYEFLSSLPHDKLATAHTADDAVETVLLHLMRGSGLRGLCGIPPKRGTLVRPLLCITHEQAVAYLQETGHFWVEDSTNSLPDCRRNRLRQRVIPLLRQEAPALSAQVLSTTTLLREEDAFLDGLAAQVLQSAAAAPDVWRIAPLSGAPPVLRRRALRLLTARFLPQDVSQRHIAALEALLASPNPSAQAALPGGWTAQRNYDTVSVIREIQCQFAPTALTVPGVTELPSIGLKIFCEMEEIYKKSTNTPFHFAVKYGMITQSILQARPRRTGDALTLRSGHTRSLKKLLIDRKVPRPERDRMAVIAAGDVLLGVSGVGVNHACAAEEGQPALLICIEKEEM